MTLLRYVLVSMKCPVFGSFHCCLVVTCWERADLLDLVGGVYCIYIPTLKRGGGYVGFGLSVISFVRSFIRPFVRHNFVPLNILRTTL